MGGKSHGQRQPSKPVTVIFRLDNGYALSAVHIHQVRYHMRQMIGVTSTRVRGRHIQVSYRPDEATALQVRNYLCAAVHAFGEHWREVMRAAHISSYKQ